MKIILNQKIDNLGSEGEIVNVKDGYARNYLIPKGWAKLATKNNIESTQRQIEDQHKKDAKTRANLEVLGKQLDKVSLKFQLKAGEEGKLFGSIGTQDIIEACKEIDVSIERSEIRMPDGPIKIAGEHSIDLHFHSDVSISISIIIESTDDPQSIEYSSIDSDSNNDNSN